MFSVNIDKLTKMTDKERQCYEEAIDSLLEICDEQCRSVAVVGTPQSAFKLALMLSERNKKMLFVDADISSSAFMGKYRLGKHLNGFMDFITEGSSVKDLVCLTNNEHINVLFTGEVEDNFDLTEYSEEIECLIAEALGEYDMIVVASDSKGEVASYCGGTVMVVPEDKYDDGAVDKKAEALEVNGCYVLGVIIEQL